jgi:hypothetical protein
VYDEETEVWFETDYRIEGADIYGVASEVTRYFFQRPNLAELQMNIEGEEVYIPASVLTPGKANQWDGEVVAFLKRSYGLSEDGTYSGYVWGADYLSERQTDK